MLIGIAGGSCSGKSTLAAGLVEYLGEDLTVVSFDDYFVGTEALKGVEVKDWESPDLYRFDRYEADLASLKAGETVEYPSNSRESTRLGIAIRRVIPRKFTVVEGFLTFYSPIAKDLFDVRVFIDLSDGEIVHRRMVRTTGTEGWDNPDYILNNLIPGHRKYVLPQREYAHIVLDGTKESRLLADELAAVLK